MKTRHKKLKDKRQTCRNMKVQLKNKKLTLIKEAL